MSAAVFREVVTAQLLLWGNGYALIDFDGSGKTKAFWPLQSNKVRVEVAADGRNLTYFVTEENGRETEYPADEVLHIPDLSFDGVCGLSRVRLHREGMGLAKSLEEFGAEYFGGGTHLSGVLQAKGKVTEAAQTRLKESWQKIHAGKGKRHQVAVLEEGLEFEPISIQANNAQFIEARKFQLNEMARLFHVQPHMIGDLDRATNNNIEHQSLEFVEYTLRTLLVRWEQELNRKLFGRGSDFYVEHNVDGLLRGDFKTRMDGYATGRQWGWLSANDIREKENMNPLPDGEGDQYLVPVNMTTPKLLENPPKPEPVAAAQQEQPQAGPQPNRSKQEIKQYLRPTFADAIRRSLNYESKDQAKLERFVSRAFAPVMCSLAEMSSGDTDVAIRYADTLHSRVANWAEEMERRRTQPAPMENILERELEMAYTFVAAKESEA
jgi:HK97 family phage portal protein